MRRTRRRSCSLSCSAMPFHSFCSICWWPSWSWSWCCGLQVSFHLCWKTDKPYSVVCGFMDNHISIAILHATHCCLWGSQIPSGCM